MYKVGIIGHKPEDLSFDAKDKLQDTLDTLVFQYKNDLVLNIGGERGIDLWTGDYCLENNIKYHLFLPCSVEKFSEFWYDEQRIILQNQFKMARSVTICSTEISNESERDALLIDNSNFIIAFWMGKKIGRTFDAVKYALSSNKVSINGLNELKLLTNADLK